MNGMYIHHTCLGIFVIARKIGPSDGRLACDVGVDEILVTSFPAG